MTEPIASTYVSERPEGAKTHAFEWAEDGRMWRDGGTFCTFSKLTTTDTDLNATTPLLYELNERKPLALVK